MESVSMRDTAPRRRDDRPPVDANASETTSQKLAPREAQAIAALALAAFSLNLNTNVLGALLPFVRQELAGDGGPLLAAAGFGSAAGALAFDRLARLVGRRAALVWGLGAFVVASALHLLPGPYGWLLALRAASGLAVGLAYAAASALVADLAPYGRRGAAMGRFNAGMFLAIPVGLPLSVAFAGAGAWRAIFAVQAAVGALGLVLALRAVPAAPRERGRGELAAVLRSGAARAGLFATLLHVGSFFVTVQLATTWLDATGVVAKDDQTAVWIGLGLAAVAGSAAFGRLSDTLGKRRFVLATSAVLVACFLFLATGPAPLPLAVVGSVLAVVASARTGPLQALVSGAVPKDQLDALMSWRGFCMQAGVGLFALASGPIAAAFGFGGVLCLAAGWQALSYVVLRIGLPEPPAGGKT
jgi:DHA1 family inner membrane transport protein